eukprot:CAMPEP_0172491758 /NCGR_PEP_ID=MMETSP1066-20121228/22615_1 /TAXON_ID=671091 /ORGANISM="Coscinodiscus wailesii, Strain CCMP2513" /LENGTH=320 /DNA_ID=CAMNT_0013260951 /DNA_START=33 /DNA_END=992 /DNA_ORIENTATION=+
MCSKKVRFSSQDVIEEVPSFRNISEREKSNIWYLSQDIASFRSKARSDCEKVISHEQSTLVDDEASSSGSSSCDIDFEEAARKVAQHFEFPNNDTMNDDPLLFCEPTILLSKVADEFCPRGLELRTCHKRQLQLQATVRAVLKAQKKIKQLQQLRQQMCKLQCASFEGNTLDIDSAILLRKVSSKFSNAARKTAIRTGLADEVVAQALYELVVFDNNKNCTTSSMKTAPSPVVVTPPQSPPQSPKASRKRVRESVFIKNTSADADLWMPLDWRTKEDTCDSIKRVCYAPTNTLENKIETMDCYHKSETTRDDCHLNRSLY